MKKIAYYILILIVVCTIVIGLSCLIFKKDYGYDNIKTTDYAPLLNADNIVPRPKNVTINGVDYLQSQLEVGNFGGNITSSIIGEPKTFNPYNATDATSSEISEIMYDGLMQTDPTSGEVIPRLALDYKILPDKKTYIIYLRRGIKWSDGRELTADDVYFTYNTIIFGGYGDGAIQDVMSIDGEMPKIEKIDKYAVKFTTPKPFAPFLRNLSASIVPKHVFEKATNKGNEYFMTFLGIDTDPKTLVTSGPFRLKEYIPAQRVVYERNPNYYLINKENKKLPYLDKWIMLIVNDTNNETLKFESGDTDVLGVNGSLVNRYRELQKHGDFDLYNLGTSTNTTFIAFNQNNRKNKNGKYYVDPKKQKWFQDKNFRSAIDWALDRDSIVLNVFSGMAKPLHSAESLKSIFLNEKVAKGHKQDLDYAKSLLLKSGFYYKNNELYDKAHNRVEIELLTNAGNTQREAAGVSIKQDIEKLGIKVNFKAVEFNSLVNKVISSVDYDAVILAFTSNMLEPNAGSNVWKINSASHIFNQRTKNDIKQTDKVLDYEKELEEIFKQGAIELDFNKRKKIYDRYQEIVAIENPIIYLYSPLSIAAIRSKIKNVYPTIYGGWLYNMGEIFIKD